MADADLEAYRRRRRFERTAEPPGGADTAADGKRYVMQKHAARRLHFDLRLELDGTLKSWAVTKGPSLVPGRRRLAVRTEDHPLDYADFEGTIPKGEYGGGTVMLWDQGVWQALDDDAHAALDAGRLHFRLLGARLRGAWVLTRMAKAGGENWLLIKRRDEAAAADDDGLARHRTSIATGRAMDEIAAGAPSSLQREPLPFVPPALATLATEVPRAGSWLFELKHDGYRVQAARRGEDVRIRTRGGHDWTDRFPSLAAALREMPHDDFVLDGEAVALDERGRSDFGALKHALESGGDIDLFLFDLLRVDGEDVARWPLAERKERLRELLAEATPPLRYSDHLRDAGEMMFDRACELGAEGIIAKAAAAPYRSGRSRAWLKIKCPRETVAAIGGFRRSSAAGRPFSSLLLGEEAAGALVYRGRVGSGFDGEQLASVHAALEPLVRTKPPFAEAPSEARRDAVWVEPRFGARIRYAELTNDGLFRHAVFRELVRRTPTTQRKPSSRVALSNPDKVLFPDAGFTKADLADYFAAVAEWMLPHVAGRPLSLVRCPDGRTSCFFQKHAMRGMPDAIRTVEIEEKDKVRDYLHIDDAAGLRAAAQLGALELHVWAATVHDLEHPTRLVFDLDPDPELGFDAVIDAARQLRGFLEETGLEAYALLTGGKGIHVVVPIRDADWTHARRFARAVATTLAEAEPDRYTAKASKAARQGKIFVDWMRNLRGATAVAPFSPRARSRAPVAVPVRWRDLKRYDEASAFDLKSTPRRLARLGSDPWEGFASAQRPLPEWS